MVEKIVNIPLSEKAVLTLNEAAIYSSIGIHKLQQICGSEEGKKISFKNGKWYMIRRKAFEEWLETVEQI